MNDPHVEWLEYDLKTTWLFDNPPPIEWTSDVFEAKLSDGVLRAEMRAHFGSTEEARKVVDPFLLAWEIDTALSCGRREIAFVFRQERIVDRNPPPPGSAITLSGGSIGHSTVSGTAQVTRRVYPPVPMDFKAVPDVVSLWTRFESYKDGREPLAPMAYFCLTVLQHKHKNRKAASRALFVDQAVLDKLGELSSSHGDMATARKMTLKGLMPFTPAETRWLDASIRALIRRLGEIASGHTPARLTMRHLPQL